MCFKSRHIVRVLTDMPFNFNLSCISRTVPQRARARRIRFISAHRRHRFALLGSICGSGSRDCFISSSFLISSPVTFSSLSRPRLDQWMFSIGMRRSPKLRTIRAIFLEDHVCKREVNAANSPLAAWDSALPPLRQRAMYRISTCRRRSFQLSFWNPLRSCSRSRCHSNTYRQRALIPARPAAC